MAGKFFKRLGFFTAAGALFTVLESKRELRNIKKKYIRLCSDKSTKSKPVRLAFIADFHEAMEGRLNRSITRLIENEGPDAIIIGGDMINGYEDDECRPAVTLMRALSDIAPVYMAPGNHEKKAELKVYQNKELFDSFIDGISDYDDIHYLSNEKVKLCYKDRTINIYGLDLDLEYYKRGKKVSVGKEKLNEYLGEAGDEYNILIAHNPEYFEDYAEWGADLTLSGHFHGGLVNIPLIGGLISPRLKVLPEYTKGLYYSKKHPDRKMYLTSGLGQHSVKVKINNIPEIIIIDLI